LENRRLFRSTAWQPPSKGSPRASTGRFERSGGPFASDTWAAGHANALIIGPQDSLETRDDIAVGVSLLAPEVRYPDHNHKPEELYMLLTPGRFQHGEADWVALEPGDTFHNDPDIRHAMASGHEPLLAVWCLLLDERLAG
jgi:quercetin dioxygenase-like cupin family protein